MSATASLPTSWKAAVAICPHCTGDGCVRCKETGDLLRALLDEAYERGRDDALTKVREVYGVVLLAGRQLRDSPPPADLKRSLGL